MRMCDAGRVVVRVAHTRVFPLACLGTTVALRLPPHCPQFLTSSRKRKIEALVGEIIKRIQKQQH